MLILKPNDILHLDIDIMLQEHLRHTSELKFDMDLRGVPFVFFSTPAHYSAQLMQLGHLLSNNTGLARLECEMYSERHPVPDSFVLNLFAAFGSIPNPLKKLHLQLSEYAFSADFLEPDNEYQNRVINLIKTKPAFQNMEQVNFLDYVWPIVLSNAKWALFFERLFCAIPNKAKLKSLSIQYTSCNFNSHDRLQNAIEECKQLTQLSVQCRNISATLWTFIGKFIKSHQTLKNISIDAKHSIHNFAFLVEALSNRRLNDVTLAFTLNYDFFQTTVERYEDGRHSLELLGRQIKCLVGLSRLKLEMQLPSLFQSLAPTLFIHIISNPTLKDLTINIKDLYINKEIRTYLLKNKTLESINNKQLNLERIKLLTESAQNLNRIRHSLCSLTLDYLHDVKQELKKYKRIKKDVRFFNRLAQRNKQRCNTYEPFFKTAALESESSCLSGPELISMNSVWFSLMASYRLNAPVNKTLQDFNRDYFMLVCYQFFNQIASYRLKTLPQDVCYHIAEYTDMHTIAQLNAITGGFFFRQVKPLTTCTHAVSMAASNAEDEKSHITTLG